MSASLEDAIIRTAQEVLGNGFLKELVQKHLCKTVEDIVKESLSPYSTFGKSLRAKVEEAVGDSTGLNLPSYNDTILKIAALQVETYTHNTIQKQVAENLKDLLKEPPATITLAALVEQYIEDVKEEREGGCVCYGDDPEHIYLRVKDDTKGFKMVDLSEKKPQDTVYGSKGVPDIRFGVYCDKIYHLAFKDADVEKKMFVGRLYGFERMLFQMKAGGTKITGLDEWESIETYIGSGSD